MATDAPEHFSFLGIGGDRDHAAYYRYRYDTKLEDGRHRADFIEEVLRSGRLSDAGDDHDHGHPHGHPHSHRHGEGGADPERSLDITEERSTGLCTYIFQLDANAGAHELTFVTGNPFIHLPLNAEGLGQALTALEVRDRGDGRVAWFTYDLWQLYDSPLAHHIRGIGREHGHAVRPVLQIPFCFNVVDSKLKASPWVVPRHSHGRAGLPPLTHGGVHPSTVSFIQMELEPGA